jgi:hypothetical protein
MEAKEGVVERFRRPSPSEGSLWWHATCLHHAPSALGSSRRCSLRTFLSVFVAAILAVVVVLCALALEPFRWCVVHLRRRAALS